MGKNNGITKEKIRRIWTICALSNCEEWNQDQIVGRLNEVSDEILNLYVEREFEIYKTKAEEAYEFSVEIDDNLKDKLKKDSQSKPVTKAIISHIVNNLRKDNIINRTLIDTEGRGPDKYGYHLIENYETFNKILSELFNPKLGQYTSSLLAYILISSKYAEKMININLLKEIEMHWNYQFNDSEIDSILKLIKMSPRALFKSLNYANTPNLGVKPFPSFEAIYGSNKNMFLFHLQMKLGEDIMYLLPFTSNKLEYKISISVDNQNGKNIESTIIPMSNKELYNDILSNKELSP